LSISQSRPANPAPNGDSRIVLDITSIARWASPPAGIHRVEQALAVFARSRQPDTALCIYDPVTSAFRRVPAASIETLLSWQGAIDTLSFDHLRYRARLNRLS
jgi:hypothetical protein